MINDCFKKNLERATTYEFWEGSNYDYVLKLVLLSSHFKIPPSY